MSQNWPPSTVPEMRRSENVRPPAVDPQLHLVLEVPDERRARGAPRHKRGELVVGLWPRLPAVAGEPDGAVRGLRPVEGDAAVVDVAEVVPFLHGVPGRDHESV